MEAKPASSIGLIVSTLLIKSPIATTAIDNRGTAERRADRTNDRATPNGLDEQSRIETDSVSAIKQAPAPEININRVQLMNQGCQGLSDGI